MLCERKMRAWASTYRAYQAGQTGLTLYNIKVLGRNAITQPSRVQSKNRQIVSHLTLRLGTQSAAISAIDLFLSQYNNGAFTRTKITTKLNTLQSYQDAIIDGVNNLGWTMDDVANYIEANLDDDEALAIQPEETGWSQPEVNGVFL